MGYFILNPEGHFGLIPEIFFNFLPFMQVIEIFFPAAGALIGAVMKETKGQADAARVRELLLGHLGH